MNEDPGSRDQELTGADGAGRLGENGDRAGGTAGPGDPWHAAAQRPSGHRSGRGRRRGRSWWVEMPILIAVALVLALLIKSFVVQAFFIPSSSMENTLKIGDKVLVNKLVYDVRPIHRGDIVVFNGEGSWNAAPAHPTPPLERLWNAIRGLFGTAPGVHDYIKRVIGLPGDHVACCDARGQVTVNGVALHERSYLYPGNKPSATPFHVTVPPGELWVMGDHRRVSYDSRGHRGDPGGGAIPESQVVGRAFAIVWPPSRWRVLPIPATFEQAKLSSSAVASARAPARAAPAVLAVRPAAVPPLALGLVGALPLLWRRQRRRGPRLRPKRRTGGARPRRGLRRW